MGCYKLLIRRTLLATTTMAVLATSSSVLQAGDCYNQNRLVTVPEHHWFLTKARLFERHAEHLVHLQTESLMLSYANNQKLPKAPIANRPNDRLKQAIADQETRVRYALEAISRSVSAHQDWHLLVNEMAQSYAAMSETSRQVADLIDKGHIDDAHAVHREKSMDHYHQIAGAGDTLTDTIENVMFQSVIR